MIKKKLSNILLSVGLSILSIGILTSINFFSKLGAIVILFIEFLYFLNMLTKKRAR